MGYKIFLSILLGAVFSGIALAVATYVATIDSNSGGGFMGPESNMWLIATIAGLIFGLILGGFSGAIISVFDFGLLRALIFGGIVNALIVGGIHLVANGEMSDGVRYTLYPLIPIGLINSVFVSMVASFSKST